MKPADLGLLRTPGTPTLSPDGRTAVVAVTRLDLEADAYRAQLWTVPTDGAEPARPLTHGWSDQAPAFSPDGRWLAFLRAAGKNGKDARPQLYVLPTDGGDARQVTTVDHHPLGAGAPVWSPDSTRIAYVARVPDEGRYGTREDVAPEQEPPRRITSLRYRLDGVGFTLDRRPHVFVVDPFHAEPAPLQVTSGDFDHADVAWSPGSDLLAFTSARHAGRDRDLRSDVFVCTPDGKDPRQVTDTTLSVSQPAFGPDGRTVYFLGSEVGSGGLDFVARHTGLYAVPTVLAGTAEGAPRRLTPAETHNHGDSTGRTVVTADGVLFGNENRGAVDLAVVPFDGGEPRTILSGQRQAVGFDAAAGVVVATVTTGDSAGELVAVRDGTERILTAFGSELARTGRVRVPEELDATAPDGYPVHGWLVRPEGPGPHPVLLLIHGGPFAQYGWTLLDEAQVYAGAGYAVVMGNPRGSSGYGQAHGAAIRYDVGERSATDLHALLDHALATHPDLDADRTGVMGGSHGGFMTTWLAGHSDRFRAAISERAVNAPDSFTGSSDIGWYFADGYYGDADRRARLSPLAAAGDIDIPMLIIHSEHDWRCPVEQAQRLFVALKLRGVETELLLFPGEGHELSRSGLPSHRIARFDAILDWWERHLRTS
ncbi:S9 family peptidase [Actinopolymorpha sp. NPDC004070]|uniref:alpha/beta hydrolase family protein n=1 Tax=Actinopolymorpha sp. NPDC004070 TaxID=3154548 RepID=UPI0033AA00AB